MQDVYREIPDEKGGRIVVNVAGEKLGNGSEKNIREGLGMFEGVFVPCCLCIFGVILYQRLGWIVGQAGISHFLIMLFVSYTVVISTALSLSALSTNGRLRGGGAYFLVSRALGPELGGAIGVIFYCANISGCVVYLLGFAAELCDILYGEGKYGDWKRTGFGFTALVGVTIICYVGPQLYAKTAVSAFTCTCVVLAVAFVSFFISSPGETEGFTGVKATTFSDNWGPHYTHGKDFATIFSILFPAVTGIMAGANMSGVLKDPSKAIPKGTLMATFGSSFIYLGFGVVIGASNTAAVLGTQTGFTVLRRVSVFQPLVSAGVFLAVVMSSMGTQIGAAQILQALAVDNLLPFLRIFRPSDGSPPTEVHARRAVIATFLLIALVLLSGADLNTMATFQTLFFLLSYAIINLACLLLTIQGSPNFRPVWKHYSWQNAAFGFVACIVVMFYAHPLRAAVAILVCLLLMIYLVYSGPDTSATWGDVTQSLLFHQVRKFLLRLDISKQHLKFWRPHVLLLADDPEKQYNLIHFANNLKKGGILLIGNVIDEERKAEEKQPSASSASSDADGEEGKETSRSLTQRQVDRIQSRKLHWGDYIKTCNLKAFPVVTTARTVQEGVQQMLMMAGLGALDPNSVLLEFHEEGGEEEQLLPADKKVFVRNPLDDLNLPEESLKRVKECTRKLPLNSPGRDRAKAGGKARYISMLRDISIFGHNLMLARYFDLLPHYLVDGSSPPPSQKNAELSLSPGEDGCRTTIDVWIGYEQFWDATAPISPSSRHGPSFPPPPTPAGLKDSQDLALMFGWILRHCRGPNSGWSRHTRLRICAFVDGGEGGGGGEEAAEEEEGRLADKKATAVARKMQEVVAYLEAFRISYDDVNIVSAGTGKGIELRKGSQNSSASSTVQSPRTAIRNKVRILNSCIRRESEGSALAIVPFVLARDATRTDAVAGGAATLNGVEAASERKLFAASTVGQKDLDVSGFEEYDIVDALTKDLQCAVLLCQAQHSPFVTEL